MFAAGLSAHLGGERIASGAGLITALVRQPAVLFQIDEFGLFMANVVDKRRAPKHLSEIWDLLTELPPVPRRLFLGAEYADARRSARARTSSSPAPACYGVSDTGAFLGRGEKRLCCRTAVLARFLVFRSAEDYS